jgi:hypothetical protein
MNEDGPWGNSPVTCNDCGHEWRAVHPRTCYRLECPLCRRMTGQNPQLIHAEGQWNLLQITSGLKLDEARRMAVEMSAEDLVLATRCEQRKAETAIEVAAIFEQALKERLG